MKTRHLRKGIQTTLEAITMLLIMFFGMLEDFDLSFAPILLVLLAILVLNTYVLVKYGKGY